MKRTSIAASVAAATVFALIFSSAAIADEPSRDTKSKSDSSRPAASSGKEGKSTNPSETAKKSASANHDGAAGRAYLGVGIESLHPSFFNHLGALLEEGTGVLVVDVGDDSPAAKAGVRPHDILMKYDDQRLYSAEQLAGLVSNDKPGRTVKLSLLREGKRLALDAELASRPEHAEHGEHAFSGGGARRFAPRMGRRDGADRDGADHARDNAEDERWTRFDSMSLTRLDKNRFKAEIKYRDREGKTDSRTFEGTRDEIRRDIQNQKDLPADERRHLLHALNPDMEPGDPFGPAFFPFPEGGFRSREPDDDTF